MKFNVAYRALLPDAAHHVLVPAGVTTPHGAIADILLNGAAEPIVERTTGQAAHIAQVSGSVEDAFQFDSEKPGLTEM